MTPSQPTSAVETLPSTTVTRLLDRMQVGDRSALDRLYPLVYQELRAVARAQRRRWRGDETLGTTALIHEVYLKLVGQEHVEARSRAHFLAIAGRAMRHVLSNYARARRTRKRGGDQQHIALEALDVLPGAGALSDDQVDAVAALETALSRLELENERLSRVVECRFFGGMSIADTAVVLGTSPATVKRDWLLARAWLQRALQDAHSAPGDSDG
jgi:RNA polymerase sigma factor (TIGR02999 family)